MKTPKLLSILTVLFFIIQDSAAQTRSISNTYLTKTYRFFENPDPSLDHHNYFQAMAGKMHLSVLSEMRLASVVPGANGYMHYKFDQYHAGLPVFGNTYILHEKDGRVVAANGLMSPQIHQEATPGIQPETAVSIAKHDMGASIYAAAPVQPILCFIDPAFPKVSEKLVLAYQIDLLSMAPFNKLRYFVDAVSGKVVCQFPLILQEGVPSKAQTKYYGLQTITSDSIGPQQFVLRDPDRGEGIAVTGADGMAFTSTSSTWNLSNSAQDEVALDAHYCAQEYFDMMLEDYGHSGLDGNGKALKIQVHNNDAGSVNAFWDGEQTNYGDGDCLYGPLTTLEVVGHEFTHGMIDHSSKLVYSQESGAINESLADMFGKLLEHKADPLHFNWDLGHSFLLSPEASPFRVMDDPASIGMPAYYKGLNWEDWADVHTNSSIGNLWFSMLTDGKQGINEAGLAFNVQALGFDKAGQIVYLTNQAYLHMSTDYPSMRKFTIEAAKELFGAGSTEAQAVAEAWMAVGVIPASVPTLDLDVSPLNSYVYECGIGEYHPIKVQIINTGELPYFPSSNAILKLSESNFPAYTRQIDDVINVGEVVTYEVNDWFLPLEAQYYFVDFTLTLEDGNLGNNTDNTFINISAYAADDLSLFVFTEPLGCSSSLHETIFYVSNNSCTTLPAGTTFTLKAEDANGTTLWSTPFVLNTELAGFDYLLQPYELPLSNSSQPSDVTFTLLYNADPDPSNNQSSETVSLSQVIKQNYLYGFNEFGQIDTFLTLLASFFSDQIVSYQGEQYFAATGINTDPEAIKSCPNAEDNFDQASFGGVTSTITACIDFSAFSDVALEFDLLQFRSAHAVANEDLYSSMFRASWTGNTPGKTTIFGQTEGELVHHKIPLPHNFNGEVRLQFYAESGQGHIDLSNLLSDDYVLLDNLRFSASAVGTLTPSAIQPVKIAPNPAQDWVAIEAIDGIRSISLHQLGGQLLRHISVEATTYRMDMNEWPNGFYLLNIVLENGQKHLQKLVKME